MISRVAVFSAVCLLSLPCLAPAQRIPFATPRIPIDGYAARVNNRVIMVSDVLAMLQPIEQDLRLQYDGTELQTKLAEAYARILDQLVERDLILEEFATQEAEIPQTMVDDQIKAIIEDRFDNDRKRFLATLRNENLSLQDWREQIAERLAVMYLRQQEVFAHLNVSPTAVVEYYRDHQDEYTEPSQVLLRMIVLQKGGEDDEMIKREEAERILERVLNGEDFAAVARAVSEGGRASRGGEWDWIEPGKLRADLAAAIEPLAAGEISEIVDTGEEFYIIKLEGRKAEKIIPFDQVKSDIEKTLEKQEERRLTDEWMNRLKESHFVELYERP